jgi:hypothetical protein
MKGIIRIKNTTRPENDTQKTSLWIWWQQMGPWQGPTREEGLKGTYPKLGLYTPPLHTPGGGGGVLTLPKRVALDIRRSICLAGHQRHGPVRWSKWFSRGRRDAVGRAVIPSISVLYASIWSTLVYGISAD